LLVLAIAAYIVTKVLVAERGRQRHGKSPDVIRLRLPQNARRHVWRGSVWTVSGFLILHPQHLNIPQTTQGDQNTDKYEKYETES